MRKCHSILGPHFSSEVLTMKFIFWSLKVTVKSCHFRNYKLKNISNPIFKQLDFSFYPYFICSCCSVTKSCPTLQPHRLQHATLPCPSLSPGVCSNSCPLSQWCYLTISSSAALFFCLQSFPASEFFPRVGYLYQVAKVLELQYQSCQWIFRVDFL